MPILQGAHAIGQWLHRPFGLVFAGGLLAFAGAWPSEIGMQRGATCWPLLLIVFCLLVWQWEGAHGPAMAFRRGGVFATAWLAATFWWLFIAMHVYGGTSVPLALAAVCALAAVLAVYYGLAAYLYKLLQPRTVGAKATLLATVWTLAELCRSLLLTGFGWGAIGYGLVDSPLAILYPYVGVFGVGALAAWLCAYTTLSFRTQPWRAVVGPLTVLILALLPVSDFTRSNGSIPVVLLQGNIPQDEKFQSGSGVPLALAWYQAAWQRQTSALFVAPETAIPLLPQDLPPGYWSNIKARFAKPDAALLTGVPLATTQGGYINGVVGFHGPQGEPYAYAKHHLVPFGEFIPPLFKWFTQLMQIPLGDFERGTLSQKSFEWNGQRLAPTICYEDLYGDELASRFHDEDSAPTVLVNLSNLGWFGDTVVIAQHLQISKVRALEFQRPFIRATNTGSTSILNYRGEIVGALAPFTRDILEGRVEGRLGRTPYSRWLAWAGFAPYWLLCVLVLAIAAVSRQRSATHQNQNLASGPAAP